MEALSLAGLRVLEIGGGIGAAYATRWMAGFGADVVRTEGSPDALTADEEVYLLAGKRRIDVEPAGLRALALAANILVEDGKPGALAAMGLDPEQLRVENPRLVVVSVTPFGQTGPYAGYEATNIVAHAMGGIMSLTGTPDRPPLVNGGSQAFYLAGVNAFGAALSAYFGALRHGRGDWVDISAQGCAAGMLELFGVRTEYNGLDAHLRSGNHVSAVWGIYPLADGHGGVCTLARQIPAFFNVVDDPELLTERFMDPVQRLQNDDELRARLYSWFSTQTKAGLLELGPKHRIPFGAVMTPLDLLENESLAERGFFDRVEAPDGRMARVPGRPFLGLPWRGGELHSPAADTPDVLTDWLGPTSPPPSARTAVPEATALPLDGIRVLDLSMMWAGPYATRILAEMGAEVLKIESPRAWDNVRTLIPQPGALDPWNSSYYFNDYNRDKKSVTLDLAQDRGRELFLDLVRQSDVVIENYRADVMDKLKIGYDVLRGAKPDIILVSMAGFGKTGPERDHVGFGPIIEQMAGLASLTGYGGEDSEPVKTGISYGDPIAGIAAAGAVALALINRDRTGGGAFIDLAQRETMSAMIGEAFVAASLRGESPLHYGNRSPRFVPQGVYPCGGVEQWLALSCRDEAEWAALARLIGVPEWKALPPAERRARHDEIEALIARWTGGRDPQEAMQTLQAAGIPAGRVLDSKAIYDDPQLNARGYWVRLPHPRMKPWRQPASAWRLTRANPTLRRHAPLFGEHNREILGNLLNLTESDFAALEAAQINADAPINPGVG